MRLQIKIKPNEKESKVIKLNFSDCEVWVKDSLAKGAANKEMFRVLADCFGIKVQDLRIIPGFASLIKIVKLTQ